MKNTDSFVQLDYNMISLKFELIDKRDVEIYIFLKAIQTNNTSTSELE